jgi:dicarboxylate/amino acid:cation (Na+ or H+) symporter, DAACS family
MSSGPRRKRLPLHTKILLGAVLGALAGVVAHLLFGGEPWLLALIRYGTRPIGQIFLRLLLMLVVPLVFAALALGVAGLGDLKSLGRIGLKTLAYTVVVSTIAVLLGLFLVNTVRPGTGVSPDVKRRLLEGAAERAAAITAAPAPKSGIDLLVQIVPDNPIRAAASGDMLAWMFFALMIGVGLCLVRSEAAIRFEEVLQGGYDVVMRLIHLVIGFAPIGVAALLFTLTADLGYEILGQLGSYVGVVLVALFIHQFVVYSLAVWFLGGMSPLRFFRGIQEAMVTAFSTASSNATLPTALKVADEELGLPERVSRFVLTIGATANQNGTALFEGVTVLFLAQFYDVALTIEQQVIVLFVCILAGVGTAGIPGGSLPVIAALLNVLGIPVEGLGLIVGVDRFLDMCRTVINVSGDLAAAVVVSRGESHEEAADAVGA